MRVGRQLPKVPDDWIIVGQVGAPYGVKGWNHIQSFTRPIEGLLKYSPWYLQQHEEWVEVTFQEARRHGEGLVAKLQGIDDRDKASHFTKRLIAIHRNQREATPEDVFYWADLEGLAVINSGEMVGRVKYLYENAGIDIMLIEHQGKEYHIPFLMQDTVLQVDLENREIVIDWAFEHPEG